MDFDALLNAAVAQKLHGDVATYTPRDGGAAVPDIAVDYRREAAEVDGGEHGIIRTTIIRAGLLASALPAGVTVEIEGRLTVRGTLHTVVDVEPDDTGYLWLTLHDSGGAA